ncbi:MAG TPA: J domain-containing protein [Polyangiaceae bacterium]|nr:J domain-containing protein [Polyangiaceae bacterium]
MTDARRDADAQTALGAAVVSIAATQRRRWFWAAWWTEAPAEAPFRKPDAANGGARTAEEALREAEKVAGRHLVAIEARWARAWMRVLRGQPPWTPRDEARKKQPNRPPPTEGSHPAQRASAWAILGLEPGASEDEIKRAYRKKALETHPDRGGDPAVFRAVQHAYERALRGEKQRGDKKRRRDRG